MALGEGKFKSYIEALDYESHEFEHASIPAAGIQNTE